MQLDLAAQWPQILDYVDRAMKANMHVAVGTVSPDGEPTVTPIGSLVLNSDPSGLFLERFPRRLGANAEQNKNCCILVENTSLWGMLRTFRRHGHIGLKLYGQFGERRPATAAEIARVNARLPFHTAKMARMLLGEAPQVRDVAITRAEAIGFKLDRAAGTITAM
ncbi:MAG: pyridoxamine 5'-phosphate oxidase family protein [Propionibacteriaceae bacterium]|jgi:hypothetical protein|nr:pyridoxamine 5'-phosphate oxidase family protein [Propionibacteriaceae bacterium]